MKTDSRLKLNLISSFVFISGVITLYSTLFAVLHLHSVKIVITDAHLTVIAGISLIYLATLLKRGKYNAWLIAIFVYIYLIARNFEHFVVDYRHGQKFIPAFLNLSLPVITLAGLVLYRRLYTVKSEPRSFAIAYKRSLLVLAIALAYGIIGFQLIDTSAFNREISIKDSAHYTIDQFGLTTQSELIAHTPKGRFFIDSLGAISLMAIVYTGVSFFAPIRFRLTSHSLDRTKVLTIAKQRSKTSEDYFKFWPQDKEYFFSESSASFLAYRVVRGVALVVGDPVGPPADLKNILSEFVEYCRINDWLVSFIHVSEANLKLYKDLGFAYQKIGEEAIVDLGKFVDSVVGNKYFRHINNKFTKLGYTAELLSPPYDEALFSKIKTLSNDWLKRPGRAERGFMLGYFSPAYIAQCQLMVAYDQDGEIKAFINKIPDILENEANYDFLRYGEDSPGNINDFLMIKFIQRLHKNGYKYLNMGLCPLSGLSAEDEAERGIVDNLLNFVYSNAGRFYSFQGLTRFKAKYEPTWHDRYIVYRGGVAGLTRSGNALLRAMTHYNNHHHKSDEVFINDNLS